MASKLADAAASRDQLHETDTANMARLAALPEELISNIAVRLDWDDLSSLRLTCKAVEAKSFHEFATEYFSAKCFMITTQSLTVLVGIANNERLRSYLRDIYIVTALFSNRAFDCPNGCNCAWRPNVRQSEAYLGYIQDQKLIKESGEDKQMLTTALRELSNLQNVRIVDGVDCFDLSIDIAGLRKVTRRTGRPPSWAPEGGKDLDYTQWLSHVWKVMIQAIAESGVNTITGLETNIASYTNGLSVSRDLNIGPGTITGLRKALTNLKRLRLVIRGNSLVKKNNSTDKKTSVRRIEQFASVLNAPEELTLKYDFSPNTGILHYNLVKNLRLSSITKLFLDMLVIDADSLSATLAPLSSIKDLKLSWINLTDGTWLSIINVLQKLTTIDHLHLMWLQEASRKAYFLSQREDPEPAAGDFGWEDVGDADPDADSDSADADSGAEDSEDDLPDLEPATTFDNPTDRQPSEAYPDLQPVQGPGGSGDPISEEELDFIAPGHEDSPERGYYVCIRGDQIAKYLPIFAKEYNVGASLEDAMDGLAGAGGPGGFNAFMNAFTNILGPLPPMPPPGPPLGGVHAGAQGNGAPGGQAPAQGGAGGQGNGAPPGFVTLGSGPGYQMMMGTLPMPILPGMPAPFAATGGAAAQNGQPHGAGGAGAGGQNAGNAESAAQAGAESADHAAWNSAADIEEHDEFLEEDEFEDEDEYGEEGGAVLTEELD